MKEKRKRPRSIDRREQILKETLDLIMHNGLSGATMTRIAAKVGITEPALYRHFKNRKDIMVAAMDAAFLRLAEGVAFLEEDDTANYMRRVSATVYEELTTDPQISRVLFEFICASPSEELRERIVEYILVFIKMLEERLQYGVEQGVIRDDLDLQLTAWESFSLGFTLSFVSLMGLQQLLPEDKAQHAIENVIERITVPKSSVRAHGKPKFASKRRRLPSP
jgi:AcrR family transcriptional regulator